MFLKLFGSDGVVATIVGHIADAFLLSIYWLLLCIPIITIGPATAALYGTVVKVFRCDEHGGWRVFYKSFRENLKQGIILTIIWLTFFVSLAFCLMFLNNAVKAQLVDEVFLYVGFGFAFLIIGIQGVLFPTLSRFENRTFRILTNSIIIAMANLPRTLAVALFIVLGVLAVLWQGWSLILIPALVCVLNTYMIEPMFAPFMPQESDEE